METVYRNYDINKVNKFIPFKVQFQLGHRDRASIHLPALRLRANGRLAYRTDTEVHYIGIPMKGILHLKSHSRFSVYTSAGITLDIPVKATSKETIFEQKHILSHEKDIPAPVHANVGKLRRRYPVPNNAFDRHLCGTQPELLFQQPVEHHPARTSLHVYPSGGRTVFVVNR